MKILWREKRRGVMSRGFAIVNDGELVLATDRIDTFCFWGVTFGDRFLGFITRTRRKDAKLS